MYVLAILKIESKEWGSPAVDHTHHVEFLVAAHRFNVDGAPYVLGVLRVLVADVGVGQLRVKRLLVWELLLVHLLPAIPILLWVYPLPHE